MGQTMVLLGRVNQHPRMHQFGWTMIEFKQVPPCAPITPTKPLATKDDAKTSLWNIDRGKPHCKSLLVVFEWAIFRALIWVSLYIFKALNFNDNGWYLQITLLILNKIKACEIVW